MLLIQYVVNVHRERRKGHGNHSYNHYFAFDLRRWWILLEEAGPLDTHKELGIYDDRDRGGHDGYRHDDRRDLDEHH